MRLRVLLGPVKIALGLALAFELIVRVVAGVGWITLVAGDIHGFDRIHRGEDVPLEERLYESDRDLIFRMRPDFRATYTRSALFRGQPATYSVETNNRGFRTGRFSEAKSPGIFRIVSIGGSASFGMNIEVESAYPQVLAELLEERLPGRFQVLNLGVPGYSSRQGLELIRQQVVAYEPDLVIFQCGAAGRFWRADATDDTRIRANQSTVGGLSIAAKQGLDRLYSFRLARQMAPAAWDRFFDTLGLPGPREHGGGSSEPARPRRVTLEGLRDAIVEGHAESERMGATFMVLNIDLWKTDAREGIRMGVAETGAAYLDIGDLFDQTRSDRTRRIEREQRLGAVDKRKTESLLRVRAPDRPGVILEWSRFASKGSDFDPMWDDGSHGDQVASDGIWSLYIPVRSGGRVLYAYWQTDADGKKTREFQPPRRSRTEVIPESGIMDIDDYGDYFLHTDSSHPDEAGHRLIAEALLPSVLEIERQSH